MIPFCASNIGRMPKGWSLTETIAKDGLTLHPEKTRWWSLAIREERAKRRGKKASHVRFPRFTQICARSRKGKFTVKVADDEEAASQGPTQSPMVPETATILWRTAANP